MPGRWKAWKTKLRFSTLPTAPWKSRISGEISTFPPPPLAPDGKVGNQKQVSHFSTRRKRMMTTVLVSKTKTEERKSAATRPPHSCCSALAGRPDFMLILRLENALLH